MRAMAVEDEEKDREMVAFVPSRQVLHQPADLRIILAPHLAPQVDSLDLVVIYNGVDITQSFIKHQDRSENPLADYATPQWLTDNWRQLLNQPSPMATPLAPLALKFPRLRLTPTQYHEIEFFARPRGSQEDYVRATFLPPHCELHDSQRVADTSPFSVEEEVLMLITEQAQKHEINPALLTGLIAQESGFRSGAVSSARAIGLTQVTPVAAVEIERRRPQWNRHPSLSRWRPWEIRQAISRERVTADQDWRLNPALSVEGGALYLQYLQSYWNMPHHVELLEQHPDIDYTAVILASYNSGAARVKNRILEGESQWLEQPGLNEAFRYVNSINSYCYHFAQGSTTTAQRPSGPQMQIKAKKEATL